MKPFRFSTWSVLLLLNVFVSCAAPKAPVTYVRSVSATTQSTNGILAVEASGFARKKAKAKQEAVRGALSKILFQGLPGSSVQRPIVTAANARQVHRDYFDRFFAEGGPYRDFVRTYNIDPRNTSRNGKYYNVALRMDIDYRALQRKLEQDGIIKKFGI